MKASLKFRDDQKKPLLRAKVPLTILGIPFQSGIVAGESKELNLNLSTFLESGPSLKLAYRPNDSQNPFSLIVKTGTGPFGSPLTSSMLMTCEFNLLNRKNNPTSPLFMLHFKPRFGDFTFKKSQSSIFDGKSGKLGKLGNDSSVLCAGSDDDVSIEVVDSPVMGVFSAGKVPIFGDGSTAAAVGAISSLFSGMEVAARTTLPVKGRAAVNFRWGVRVPAELKGESGFQKVPFLVMDKIGVEHSPERKDLKKGNGTDVAETCFTVKRQIEGLEADNGLLRKAVEDLRREIGGVRIGGGGSEFAMYREFERNGGQGKNYEGKKNEKKKLSDFSGYPGKSTEAGGGSEELKKTFQGATSVGV